MTFEQHRVMAAIYASAAIAIAVFGDLHSLLGGFLVGAAWVHALDSSRALNRGGGS